MELLLIVHCWCCVNGTDAEAVLLIQLLLQLVLLMELLQQLVLLMELLL